MWRAPLRETSPPRLARAGLRLAALQAAVIVIAFAVAGYVTEASLRQITQQSARDHILGESASLDDEVRQKGLAHLPYTVAKRSRLWRGFEYRLADAGGAKLAGGLERPPSAAGWGQVAGLRRAGNQPTRYLTYSHRLADGSVLTVGQDLAIEAGEGAAIRHALLECGLLGVATCILLSALAARRTWRRIAAISSVAAAVARGRLDVRVPVPARPVRDDIDVLSGAINGMLERIEGLMGQVRQVSTDIAHDLRTPLNRFRHKLERVRTQVADDPDHLAAVLMLERELDEIVRTFDALLQLSEIETGELADIAPANLAEVVERVVEAFRPDLEAAGHRLDVRSRPVMVAADERLLAQSLANLLENAMRHTPPGTRVVVETGEVAGQGCLTVTDNGPGMTAEDRKRVLKPFVRLSASRTSPGSGLGLSIVAAVAQRYGATLELEDAEPGFRVQLGFPQREP